MKEEEAIELLRKHIPEVITFKIVYNHSRAVQELALKIAKDIPDVDIELLKNACMLHDIGRYKCHKEGQAVYRHGLIGAEILRKEGHEKLAQAAERHVGAGISKEDIKEQKLDLPSQDFIPQTKEEKILSDADNCLKGTEVISIEETAERFKKKISESAAKKVLELHKEVEAMKR